MQRLKRSFGGQGGIDMKNSTLWIVLAILIVIMLGGLLWWKYGSKNVMPGSDRDEHGCIGSAGYTWCESMTQCVREWETPCVSSDEPADLTAPKYLSQMEDCRAIGGAVEETQKDMGSWTALDQWRCTCTEGQTFSDGLQCNAWMTPETQ